MRKLFFLQLLWVSICTYGQTDNPKFFPPSPNAYALGKYGDIPVNLYTGVPDITIPVYTASAKEITVPISLSYHGSGIKVDETASDVGLGWALNAGGVITRSVRGRAEYLQNGILQPKRADIPECTTCNTASGIDNFVTQYQLPSVVDGGIDGEPDIFYYNFNGRSGKFWFDKNGIPRLNKDEPIEVSWVEGTLLEEETFIIKDERGFKYEFYDRERSFYGNNEGYKVSAWYLSKITSPTGNVVTFTYETYTFKRTDRSYTSAVVNIPANKDSGGIFAPLLTTYTSAAEVGIRISEINTLNEKVQFSYVGGRLDVPAIPASGAVRLDKIIVRNAVNNTIFKSFNLYASYFEANNSRKYDGQYPNENQHLNYRLRLDSVKEVSGTQNVLSAPYKFYYLGDNDPNTDDPYTLPYRLSPAQDYWGYYNFSYNKHMLPGATNKLLEQGTWYSQFTPEPNSNTQAMVSLTRGADRNVEPVAIKANALSIIEYPTGGRTAFVFEPNDYKSFQGGMRIKKMQRFAFNENQPVETSYTYTGSYSSDLNPEKYSFEYYHIEWITSISQPAPSQDVLNMFGLPVATGPSKTVKVLAWPTAILGALGNVGHATVTVQQPGKGSVVNFYSTTSDYPDYFNRDVFNEETQNENALLGGLYKSEGFETTSGPSNFGYETKNISYGEFPFNELYSNDWKRGALTDRKTYNQNAVLIKSELFNYYRRLKSVVPGYKVVSWRPNNSPSAHLYSSYLVPQTWSQLKSSIVTDYDVNGQHPTVSETKYYYDNADHLQATRIETKTSEGKTETKFLSYPMDYPSGTGFIDAMKSNHLWAYPIEQVSYVTDQTGNYIQSGSITEYSNNAKGLPVTNYSLEGIGSIPLASFKFSNRSSGTLPSSGTPAAFLMDFRYKPAYSFNMYDSKGNLLEAQKAQGKKEAYLWGYNGIYPVAKVTGSDYVTAIGTVSQSQIDANSGNESNLRNVLNNLRSIPNTLVSTYTYQPLLGMASETDAGGRTVFYEYDELGRLRLAKDLNQQLLKVYEYKFNKDINPNIIYYSNTIQKQTFYKDCSGTNGSGGPIEYMVPAGTYVSTISVQDANLKALAEITAKGQQYANDNGYCVFYNDGVSQQFQKNDCPGGTVGTYVSYSVAANTFSSLISKADANSKALQEVLRLGQHFANANGQCRGVFAPNITLTNYFPGLTYFPREIKVEILEGNWIKRTEYFPYDAEASWTFQLDAGTYTIRFTMSGWPGGQPFTTYYFVPETWQEWNNNGDELVITTDEITFEQGLNYTIRASNSTN